MSRGRVVALVLLVCAPALRPTRTVAQSVSLLERAVTEYAAERYAEARSLFERAHAQQPSARTLRALGFCDYELRHYARSAEELEAALNASTLPLTPPQRAEVEQMLDKARRFVGKLVVATTPPDAQLRVDGEVRSGRQLTLDSGKHELEASLAADQTRTAQVSVAPMETVYVALALPALELTPRPTTRATVDERAPAAPLDRAKFSRGPSSTDDASLLTRWWFWTAAGLVVAGATVAAVVASNQTEHVNGGTTGVVLQTH